MYQRVLIKLIKKGNKNSTRSKNQSEHIYDILQGVINGTGEKKTQNKFNRLIKIWKGEKHNNQLKHCDMKC